MAQEYDGIIIGAGPNGLTLAAYLAKAGLKILVLEKRFEAGGGLATEQVTLPGFLHNTHAIYMPMVDYAPPLVDFDDYLTQDYDLEFKFPDPVMAMAYEDGSSLCLYQDIESFYRLSSTTASETLFPLEVIRDDMPDGLLPDQKAAPRWII